jgi:hypothetical protein
MLEPGLVSFRPAREPGSLSGEVGSRLRVGFRHGPLGPGGRPLPATVRGLSVCPDGLAVKDDPESTVTLEGRHSSSQNQVDVTDRGEAQEAFQHLLIHVGPPFIRARFFSG